MLAFANYRCNPALPDLVLPSLSSDAPCPVYPVHRLPEHASLFRPHSRASTALRYGRFVACFNLYPACRRDLDINHLLWTVARNGEYDPATGNILLENNVLALAFPVPFYNFLASVTREELDTCTREVLALIAEGEDTEGLNLMKQELEPSVWEDLMSYMKQKEANPPTSQPPQHSTQYPTQYPTQHPPQFPHALPAQAPQRPDEDDDEEAQYAQRKRQKELMLAVEMLLRLCHLSPWKIEVYASFVTPRDMGLILTDLSSGCMTAVSANGATSTPRPVIADALDRPLVRSGARRPVWTSRERGSAKSALENRLSNKKLAFWRQFQSWRLYRRVLVAGCGFAPVLVTEAMLATIANGSIEEALLRAETVMACAYVRGNLLSDLPKEVVFRYIAPYVLLAG